MSNAKSRIHTVTRICAAVCLNLLAQTTVLAGGSDSFAKTVLLRYMERGRNVEYTAIRLQRSGCDDLGTLQLKVQNNVAGQQCITVLAPLAMQGQILLDDSRQSVQFFPDENRKVISKSPSAYLPSPKERLEMAEKNYSFSISKGASIAGRSVLFVTATPKERDMPVRRFGIDEKTYVILRMETIEDGKSFVFIDTRAIDFKPSGSLGDLSIKPASGVRTIIAAEPVRVTSNAMAMAMTGIAPIVPSKLPGGFFARDPEILGSGRDQFIAVRITDGLATATIYQINTSRASSATPLLAGTIERSYGNVRFAIAGDLPSTMLDKILVSFVQEGIKLKSPSSGSTRNSVGGGERLSSKQSAAPKTTTHPTVESTSAKGGD